MAYFENVAADLDVAQSFTDFAGFTERNMSSLLPFLLAEQITAVPYWNALAAATPGASKYVPKVAQWLRQGVNFNLDAADNCELSEQYFIESVRLARGKSPLSQKSLEVVRPAVIFTVGETAVGYKKSVGAETTYGLRSNKHHSIWAEVISVHDFEIDSIGTTASGIIVHELADGETFIPIRPGVTSFDAAGRRALARNLALTPLAHKALTLQHYTLVQAVDATVQAMNDTIKLAA